MNSKTIKYFLIKSNPFSLKHEKGFDLRLIFIKKIFAYHELVIILIFDYININELHKQITINFS